MTFLGGSGSGLHGTSGLPVFGQLQQTRCTSSFASGERLPDEIKLLGQAALVVDRDVLLDNPRRSVFRWPADGLLPSPFAAAAAAPSTPVRCWLLECSFQNDTRGRCLVA